MTTNERKRTTSYCRICPCYCGIVVESIGDQVVRVMGDPDHPMSQGYTCAKGRAGTELHHHPARLDIPLIRGEDGELRPAPWDEVLDDIASRLRAIIDEHGSQAVAQYIGSNGYDSSSGAAHAFLTALGSTNSYSPMSIDATSKWFVPELMLGAGLPIFMNPDFRNTDLLLLVGNNAVVSHGHTHHISNPIVELRRVKARGGMVIVVDPRLTETAHLADIHVCLRPGTDPALMAYLVNQAIERRADREFLAAADPSSLESLARAVAPYTRDRVAAICDITPDVLDRVCEAVCAARRVAVGSGTGASMNAAANVTEWLCTALLCITGSLDRLGGAIFNPMRRSPLPPDVAYEDRFEEIGSGRRVLRIMGSLPCAALADEIVAGSVRAMFVLGGNPAVVFPDAHKIAAAMRSLDLLVVTEIRHTDTTELATHVLPTTGQFERADLNISILTADPFVQYTPAVVPLAAERKPIWWIYSQLGRRLGIPLFGERLDQRFSSGSADDDILIELSMARSGCTAPFDVVKSAEHGFVDSDAPPPGWLVPGALSRQIDLAPTPVLAQFEHWEQALPADDELVLICRRLPRQVNSLMREVESQLTKAPHPTLLLHPLDAEPRGICDGDAVNVATATGEVPARAEITDSIRPGAVSLTHGWGMPNVNVLMSDADADPITLMPWFTGLPVTISRAEDAPAWR